MNTSKTVAITAALIGVLGFSGLMRSVYARSPQVDFATNQSSLVAEVSDGDGEVNDNTEERQEQAKLQPLAKITPLQAQQAAKTAVGDTVTKVKLENEDGNLIYSVIVGQKEVAVDAGNGKVLYAENNNQNDDKNATSRPKSSIQVPETEQGEMNDEVK